MSGGGKQSSTQTTEIKLPAWVEKASQSNYQKAQDIAGRPYNPYTGETVAGLPQETLDAINYLKGNIGVAMPGMQNAAGSLTQLLGFDPGSVTAGTVTPQKLSETDLAPYLNPYINEVETNSLNSLDRARQGALNQNASKAAAAGSFGGSRSAIIDAVTNSESARAAGDLSAELRKAGYENAQNAAIGDITRDLTGQTTNASNSLQAQLANMQAAISGAGVRTNAANSLTDNAKAQQESIFADIAGLNSAGQTLQSQEQAYLDRDKRQFDEAQNYDTEMLNLLLASLGMSPYGRTETTTKQSSGGGTDWASVGLGAAKLGMGLFGLSEDNEKTDIKKIGDDPDTGLGIFAYRYKGDPKSYPKVVGPMASEIEKKYPKAVGRVGKGGKKTTRVIDFSQIGV